MLPADPWGILALVAVAMSWTLAVDASDNSKSWDASDKAKQFVRDTIVIDTPHGVGWTEPADMHDYLERAWEAGITGGYICE